MEGGLEALPVIEPSGSDVEISVDPSTQCGFMVDLGLFVLSAGLLRFRFSLPRLRLLLPRSVLVVLPSLPSRGVTMDTSHLVFSHVCVMRSRAFGMFKTLSVLWTPCSVHRQLRRCT